MNLLQALAKIGGGAANMTGLPYLINTDIVNPIKQTAAQLTGNRQAYANTQRKMDKELTLQKFVPNAAAALTLPMALGKVGSLWRAPEEAAQVGRLGPNARYTLADFADYKMGRYKPSGSAINELSRDARGFANKAGVDILHGSPREIDMRIADLLERFQGL